MLNVKCMKNYHTSYGDVKYCAMFKLIQRYLASNFILPFCFSSLFFVMFLLTFQLFRIVRIVTNKGVEPTLILELVGHIAISFLPMAIPLSCLFATIYTLNKMSEDSEIVAMRSFGVNKRSLFTPFLIMGLFIAASIFVLNRNLIPFSKTQFKNRVIQLTSKGMLSDVKPGQFYTEIPNVTLFAENVENGGTKLEDVFIRIKRAAEEQVIFAKRGALIKQATDDLSAPIMRLHLIDGNIIKTFSKKKQIEKILFKEYDFPIMSGGGLPGFVTKDSMRTNKELLELISQKRSQISKLEKIENPNEHQKWLLKDSKKNLPKSELEYWGRINTPIQVLMFILLGFSLGIKKGRGRTRNSGAISMFILTGYYALFFLGVSLARKGILPAPVSVFLPGIIGIGIGVNYFKKLDWMS